MKQMKKILSVALALVLVVLLVPNMNVSAADATTVTGYDWWHASNTKTEAVSMYGDGTIVFQVEALDPTEEGLTVSDLFLVELYDANGNYFTTTSFGDCWFAGGAAAEGNTLVKDEDLTTSAITTGEVSWVTVTREGKNVTVTYTNSWGEIVKTCSGVAACDFAGEVSAHVFAQYGKFSVTEVPVGSYYNPYQLSTESVRFYVYVPAGTTQYVKVDNCNGSTLKVEYVNDESGLYNYMVQYGRMNMYYPEADGTLSFTMQEMGDAFSVYNAGETDITVYMSLTAGEAVDTTGTYDNPEKITELFYSYFDKAFEAGNSLGYYYLYTAEGDGTITLEIPESTEGVDVDLSATNKSTSVNKTFSADSFVDDLGYEVIQLPVSAGDEVLIQVYVLPDANWQYPAANITWSGTFNAVLGSEQNPIYLQNPVNDITVTPGTDTYYAAYGVGGTTLSVKGENVYVIYNGTPYVANADGVILVELESAAMPGAPVTFQVGTNGTADSTAELEFIYPEGTYNNPADLVAGDNVVEFEEGASDYYYEWTAPADGTVTIGVASTTGWFYYVNIPEASVYGDWHYSNDEVVVSSETLEVTKGDVLKVVVLTFDEANPWAIPAGKVTTTVTFVSDEVETETESESNTESGEIDKKGDLSSMVVYMVVLMGAALVVVGFVAKKKIA